MTVKNILKIVSTLLNRKDLISYLTDGSCDDYERVSDDLDFLLCSYNVVAEELATVYLKLKYSEKLVALDNKIKYSNFTFNPICIKSVKNLKGEDVNCNILPTEIIVDEPSVFVEYIYSPPNRGLDDESDYSTTPINKSVIAYGIATEYCLMKGMYEEGSVWHDKYTMSLKNALSNKVNKKIKSRTWW